MPVAPKDEQDIVDYLQKSGVAGTHGGRAAFNARFVANFLEQKNILAPFAKYDKVGNRQLDEAAFQQWADDPANIQKVLDTMFPSGNRGIVSSPSGYSVDGQSIALNDRDTMSSLPRPTMDFASYVPTKTPLPVTPLDNIYINPPAQKKSVNPTPIGDIRAPGLPPPPSPGKYSPQPIGNKPVTGSKAGGLTDVQLGRAAPGQYSPMSVDPNDPPVINFPDGSYITKSGKSVSAGGGAGAPVSAPATGGGGAAQVPVTYTIKKGDNLSAIARANNTTVAELMKLNPNITNPNLIYAGKTINLPGQKQAQQDFSQVNNTQQANDVINAGQKADAQAKATNEAPPVKKTTADYLKEIKDQVTPTTPAPVAPNFTDTLNNLRLENGVTALETQVNDLKAQEADILANKQARVNAARSSKVALNVVEGRVGEIERQENERLTVIQNSIANATNQLNTKYNLVNQLMQTKQLDYTTAVAAYDKQFSNNIALFNAAKGIEEADKTEANRIADNARANAQILISSMNERGLKYSELSPSEQITLNKLGAESGLGGDFFKTVMEVSGGKDILTTITSNDDTKVSIIYKDGTTKTIATGLPRKTTSGGGLTKTELKEQQMAADRQTLQGDVGRITGKDRKVDPVKMNALRQDVALNNPELLSWFDNAYEPRNMLNPDRHPLSVKNNVWGTD